MTEASVRAVMLSRILYFDRIPPERIWAPKTWEALFKYSYSCEKPTMCRTEEDLSVSSHPLRIPRSSIRVKKTPPGELASSPTQNESKGCTMSPSNGSP